MKKKVTGFETPQVKKRARISQMQVGVDGNAEAENRREMPPSTVRRRGTAET
jgi:hypothetical protein